MTTTSLIVVRKWVGTAMSDCPPPPQGVSRLSWFSRIRHEENTPGASGQFCPSLRNSCHFKRREALDFWKLSLGLGAPLGNSVMALRSLLSVTLGIIAVCASHPLHSRGKPPRLLHFSFHRRGDWRWVWLDRQIESVQSWLGSVWNDHQAGSGDPKATSSPPYMHLCDKPV